MMMMMMDSCSATLRTHTDLARAPGLWGQRVEGSLLSKHDQLNRSSNSLKVQKRVSKNIKLGVSTNTFASENEPDLTNHTTLFDRKAEPRSVVAIILGGGAGTELFPLTIRTAVPAVPVGGCYKLIDIPLSNCINAGLNKIFVLTQFNSAPLNRHIHRTYYGQGVNFGDGFVEVLAATQTPGASGMKWFQGTADAVRQFMWLFEDGKNKDIGNILILSGDQLYRMDYMEFIQHHLDTNADMSVSCVPVDESHASRYGLMKIDNKGQVVEFSEKPKGRDLKSMSISRLGSLQTFIKSMFGPPQQENNTMLGLPWEAVVGKPYIASMGVYIFKTEVLRNLLKCRYPTANDFGSEVIPAAVKELNVQAFMFKDYWEDIGTLKTFYEANLALTKERSNFEFYDPNTPFYTSPRFLPPTKMDNCKIKDSIISHGCFLKECFVRHSIVGERSRLDRGAELKDTLMLGADYYQTELEIAALLASGKVPIGIGQNSKVRKCIIDKNAGIGKDVIIKNKDGVQEADRPQEGFYIRSGIVIIMEKATIPDGAVI